MQVSLLGRILVSLPYNLYFLSELQAAQWLKQIFLPLVSYAMELRVEKTSFALISLVPVFFHILIKLSALVIKITWSVPAMGYEGNFKEIFAENKVIYFL